MMVGPIADKTRAKGNWPLHEGKKRMTVATLESVGCQSQLEPMKTAEAAFQQAYPAYAGTAAWTTCGPATTPAGPPATSTWTTPAAACTPSPSCATPGPAGRRGLRQPALQESVVAGHDLPGGARPGSRCWSTSVHHRDEYDGHLHPECHRRAQAGRRVLPLRAGRQLPADLRQPQLGQRHPRVRPRQGRHGDLRPDHPADLRVDMARYLAPALAAGPAPARTTCSPSRPSPTSPACSTPWTWIAQAQTAGLRRAAGRRLVRALQPAGPLPVAPRLRDPCRFTRSSATPPASAACWCAGRAAQAAATMVRRRHDHLFLGAWGRRALPDPWPGRLRGRHGQLPQLAGRRNRPGPHRARWASRPSTPG